MLSKIAEVLLIYLLRFYQLVASPMLHALAGPGSGCRFHPTCSRYALEAIRLHGPVSGSWLAVRRLLRCQPFASKGSGFDPVPRHL